MVTGEVLKNLFIVCLCATGLKFYQQQDDHWSCFQTDKLDTLVCMSVPENVGYGGLPSVEI